MSHPNESHPQHTIPTVAWHNPGAPARPGTLRPLPLPVHPHVPAIPGGLPGVIPGRSSHVPLTGHLISAPASRVACTSTRYASGTAAAQFSNYPEPPHVPLTACAASSIFSRK